GPRVRTSASFVNENPAENFGASPTISLRYQPIPDVMLRASWRQSIRPPTFDELFTPITQTFPMVFGDPFIVLPSNYIWIGGNPTLKPETTDAYSAGIVWSPRFFQGFVMTMDAYQIFTTNLVLDPDSVTRMLLATNTVDPDGCGLGVIPGGGPAQGVTRDRFN